MVDEQSSIGIIGAGYIGAGLARLATAAGFDVYMSNSRDPESIAKLAASIGPTVHAVSTAHVADHAQAIFAAIPLGRYRELPVAALAGKTVIDTMNYYPDRDGRMAELDADSITSSELLQLHLPDSSVVKGANNLDYVRLETQARPLRSRDRSAMPIAGDDTRAKEIATDVISRLGYDVVDYGTLAESWRSQPGAPVYVSPYQPTRPSAQTRQQWFADAFHTPSGTPVPSNVVASLLQRAVR